MKNLLLATLATLTMASAFAGQIQSATLDAEQKNILIDVTYGGGCGKHEFSLELGGCLESFPVQCSAKLIHKTDDACEALIGSTAIISLAQYGLTDSYFAGGSLRITGDYDPQTKKASEATVVLPK